MTSRTWMVCICALGFAGPALAAAAQRCSTEFRLPILLRLSTAATATPTAAFLIGDLTPGLRIIDARSGRLLWTAGATGLRTQLFPLMTAGFSSSLAALDTDGDGAHDRIYAGDLRGRLWRFDIDARGAVSSWVAGGIFADLGGTPVGASGRGFIAAPDLSLIANAGVKPWLSIALGTANTSTGLAVSAPAPVLNRFYVVRDRAPFEHWTQNQYDRWRPLVESDLVLAEGTPLDDQQERAGFYVNLGAQQVAAAALTIEGKTFYTTVANSSSLLPNCAAALTPVATALNVSSISANGSLNAQILDPSGFHATPSDSAIKLARDDNNPSGVVCEVAGHAVPGCSIDTTLHRSFWRREDAD